MRLPHPPERLEFSASLQPACHLDAGMLEDFQHVGRIGEFFRQVLSRKMQILMQPGPPFGAIGDIIHNSIQRNIYARAALARTAAQFHFADLSFGKAHTRHYTCVAGPNSVGCVTLGRRCFADTQARVKFQDGENPDSEDQKQAVIEDAYAQGVTFCGLSLILS